MWLSLSLSLSRSLYLCVCRCVENMRPFGRKMHHSRTFGCINEEIKLLISFDGILYLTMILFSQSCYNLTLPANKILYRSFIGECAQHASLITYEAAVRIFLSNQKSNFNLFKCVGIRQVFRNLPQFTVCVCVLFRQQSSNNIVSKYHRIQSACDGYHIQAFY